MATYIFEHSDLAGSDLLGEVLRDNGHRLRVLRPDRGDALPPDLDDVDAIVACGGGQSPLDGDAWLAAEMELLRAASEASLPVVGLCFGSQILARALGGTVARMEGAPEIGWGPVRLTPAGRDDPLYAGLPWVSTQLHWHGFHVETPPPGARVLAKSETTPVQAWALGLRTYGFQYHPEAHASRAAEWADDDPDMVKAAGTTKEQVVADTERHHPVAARLALRLFERIALLLMPLDRRYAGIAKDVHH